MNERMNVCMTISFLTQIPFAGSEVHLLDEMESVCGKLKDYAERVDPETKIKTFVRFNARNDKDTLELTHVSINAGISKALEVAVSL